mmetsp:Transcript_6376/g.7969  ORF Transcript_6376/g.7969 Transcript_6376/m.7969 type:complete len:428 (+) Transcript_6376:81-1364(+)
MYWESVNSCLFLIADAILLLIFFFKALFFAFLFLLADEQQHFLPEEELDEPPNNEEPLLPVLVDVEPDEELELPSNKAFTNSLTILLNNEETPPFADPNKSLIISSKRLPSDPEEPKIASDALDKSSSPETPVELETPRKELRRSPKILPPLEDEPDEDEPLNKEEIALSAIAKILRNNPFPEPEELFEKTDLIALEAKLKISCNKLPPLDEVEEDDDVDPEPKPSMKLPILSSAIPKILSIKLSPDDPEEESLPLLNNDSIACSAIERAPLIKLPPEIDELDPLSNKEPIDFSAISRTSSKRLSPELDEELELELVDEFESKRLSIALLAPLIISSKKSPLDRELEVELEDESEELESPNNESKRSSKSEPPVELEDLVVAVVVELELPSSPPKTESKISSRIEPLVEVDVDFEVAEVLVEEFESA